MRKILLGLIMAMGAQVVAAEDAAKAEEWLFVHTAETAEIPSVTTLVMSIRREIFAFTNRPDRMYAYLTANEFTSLWDEGGGHTFYADPSNAVLTWENEGQVQETKIVILKASVSENGRSINYKVKVEVGAMPDNSAQNLSLFFDAYRTLMKGGKKMRNRKAITSNTQNFCCMAGTAPPVQEQLANDAASHSGQHH